MTLGAPIAISTVATVAAVLAGLTVVAYILKMRRRRFEVPFSTLWNRVLKERESTSLFKHLRRLLSLLLMLGMLGLLLLAVLDPRLGSPDADARSVVLIVDASASMKAVDEGPDGDRPRMAVARDKAQELLAAMGGGDMAMVMRMDGQSTPLGRFDNDMAMLRKAVAGIQASDTPADLGRALRAAADALRGRRNPMIVLVGDGAYPEEVLASVWRGEADAEPGADTDAEPAADADADAAQLTKSTAKRPTQSVAGAGPAAAQLTKSTAKRPTQSVAAIDLRGIDLRFIPVGQARENVGIVAFNARRYVTDKTSYAAYVEVQNFGEQPAARKLVVYSGDSAVDVKTITLAPGQRLREMYPNLSGGQDSRLRAQLQPATGNDADTDTSAEAAQSTESDVFPLDDQAFALLPARKKQKVLLVTEDNLYLEGAMLVYDSIQVDKLTRAEYDQAVGNGQGLPETYDAVVFDEHTPAQVPPAPTDLVYFGPSGEHSPFAVRRVVPFPRVTEVAGEHPVMRWVVLSDVNFDQTGLFAIDRARGDAALAYYVRDPMIAARHQGGRKIVAFGFGLDGTDLPLRVAFPLVLVNTLDWFAGDDADLITTYRTGRRFRVPLDGVMEGIALGNGDGSDDDGSGGMAEVELTLPTGRRTRAPVADGRATFYGHTIGVHRLAARAGGQVVAELELAANLASPAESNIAPRRELVMGGAAVPEPDGFHATRRQSLWQYLAIAAALLLCMEWLTYHRRMTV